MIFSQIEYFLGDLVQYFIALCLSIISTFALAIRTMVKGSPRFLEQEVYGKSQQILKLKLIDSSNWYIRNTFLFPLVLSGKLRLVGISMHPIRNGYREAALSQLVPGIVSLYSIRHSARLANTNARDCDLEYLQNLSPYSDITLFMQSLVVSTLNHGAPNSESVLNVFGINILNLSMLDAISVLNSAIEHKRRSPCYFVNADCLNKVFGDREYYYILKNNKIVFPDGSGINLASKILGTALKENLNGTDMLPYLCELAQQKSYRIFLLGAAPDVAENMKIKLQQKYPGLNICGTRNGYFDWKTQIPEIIQEINVSEADILLVALGAPLQEFFINTYGSDIEAPVQMGVGGLFDFYSQRIARAPIWMRQTGLEWVFRLIQEPRRMWKRYIIGNPLFIYRVYRWKNSGHIDIHQ